MILIVIGVVIIVIEGYESARVILIGAKYPFSLLY